MAKSANDKKAENKKKVLSLPMRGKKFNINDRGTDFAQRAEIIMHNNKEKEINMEKEGFEWEKRVE